MLASNEIIALDVGLKRIGVARANAVVKLAEPLGIIENNSEVWGKLKELCDEHGTTQLVVGLPRSLSGEETNQTKYAREFATEAGQELSLPVALQDEAVTSRQAEEELKLRGKSYNKADVDALAAVYILEDYLTEL